MQVSGDKVEMNITQNSEGYTGIWLSGRNIGTGPLFDGHFDGWGFQLSSPKESKKPSTAEYVSERIKMMQDQKAMAKQLLSKVRKENLIAPLIDVKIQSQINNLKFPEISKPGMSPNLTQAPLHTVR